MNTYNRIVEAIKVSPVKPKTEYRKYYRAFLLAVVTFTLSSLSANAQGFGLGLNGGGAAGGMGGYGGGMGNRGGGAMGGGTSGSGTYYGQVQAGIDQKNYSGNHEMLRNDTDYEDYLLQKRNAFAQQMQQNQVADDKLRTYAESRLKTLAARGAGLSSSEQAESHDLMDWLKKDAEQRANNLSWLKRQDSEIAMVEQDQDVAFKNQRNALHNMYEDSINVESQYKWNQQMQLAQLHIQQETYGQTIGQHQPSANQGFGYGSYGGLGGGFAGGWGRRW